MDAKILHEQIHHYQSVQIRLQNELQEARLEYNTIRKSTECEIKAHIFTKIIVDMWWQACIKLCALLESQEELMEVDSQGELETIDRL